MTDFKTQLMTDLDSEIMVRIPVAEMRGVERRSAAGIEVTDADFGAGDVARWFRVRSGDVPVSINLRNQAVTGATLNSLGLYAIEDGPVVNATAFLDGTYSIAGAHSFDELLFAAGSSRSLTIDDMGKAIWEILGLTVDPHLEYDLVWTFDADPTPAAPAQMTIEYCFIAEG